MDPLIARPPADDAAAQRKHATVEAMKAKNIPINSQTTVEQIVRDFHARSLKSHPSQQPVPPGEGLLGAK